MSLLQIAIVLAILATLGATILGLMSMSSGGETDQEVSTPLMWSRIGLQVFTLLLLGIALLLK
jgi:hypothetical protein